MKIAGQIVLSLVLLTAGETFADGSPEVPMKNGAVAPPQEVVSVRARLQRAIEVNCALAAQGQKAELHDFAPPAGTDEKAPLLLPRLEDLKEYARVRPWTWHYASPHGLFMSKPPIDLESWPAAVDATELCKLLDDSDSAIRCLAVEALGTLRRREDETQIRARLKDLASGPPTLYWNMVVTARFLSDEEITVGGVCRNMSWQTRTVAASARRALCLITGQSIHDQTCSFEKQLFSDDMDERLEAAINLEDIGTYNHGVQPLFDALFTKAHRPKPAEALIAKQGELISCMTRILAGYHDGNVMPSVAWQIEKEKDPRARVILVRAVGEIGAPRGDTAFFLLPLVNDKDDELRAVAIQALGKLHWGSSEYHFGSESSHVVKVLVAVLNDPYPSARSNAIKALGQMGTKAKDAVPSIQKCLNEEDDASMRRMLLESLNLITSDAHDKVRSNKPDADDGK